MNREIKIVAILFCSAGNDSVGDMWRETKIFELNTPIEEVIKWANRYTYQHPYEITCYWRPEVYPVIKYANKVMQGI